MKGATNHHHRKASVVDGKPQDPRPAEMTWRQKAEAGSSVMRLRMELAFTRFGNRFGISKREAQLLLMDTGVSLPGIW